MDLVLAQFVTGLAHASTLFLVAAGLTIIFGVTRVVNFAHGSLVMLGAYIAYSITTRLPATPPAFFGGLLLAALAVALLGALLELLLLRRIYAENFRRIVGSSPRPLNPSARSAWMQPGRDPA